MSQCFVLYYLGVLWNSIKFLGTLSSRFFHGTCCCNASISTGWVYIHHNTCKNTPLTSQHAFTISSRSGLMIRISFELFCCPLRLLGWLYMCFCFVSMVRDWFINLKYSTASLVNAHGICYRLGCNKCMPFFSIETQNPIKVSSYVIVISERETSKKVFSSISRKHWQHFAKTSLKMTKLVIFIFILRLSTQLSHTLWHFAD